MVRGGLAGGHSPHPAHGRGMIVSGPLRTVVRVARHDLQVLSADRTLWAAAGLLAALMACGLWNGLGWVRVQRSTLVRTAAEERERYARARQQLNAAEPTDATREARTDPRNPASFGSALGARYAVMPPSSLALLAVGQSDLYPSYVKVSTRRRETFANDEIENPLNLLAGRLDAAFVIVYLLPLVVIALSYNLVSGEREQGTLSLVLSQPVTLRRLVAGKLGTRGAAVAAVAIGMSLVGGLMALRQGAPPPLARLLLWSAFVAAYASVWFALATAANTFTHHSSANAAGLVSVWLLLVVVTPAAVNLAARTWYPVPSRVEMIEAIRDASLDTAAKGSQLLARYFEDHPDLIPGGATASDLADFNAQTIAVQDEVARRVEPVLARYDDQLLRQQRCVDRLRFLSPAIVTQEALNAIAGTDAGRYRDFIRQVDAFHRRWQRYFNDRAVLRVSMTPEAIDGVPIFVFEERPLSGLAPALGAGLIGLIAPALALTLFAWRRMGAGSVL
jgi:ABC-2 type transport system permease protein